MLPSLEEITQNIYCPDFVSFKMTKFSFLIEYLGGKIHEVVKRLSVTESSFNAAIIRLNERYDNPEQLVTYYKKLKEI